MFMTPLPDHALRAIFVTSHSYQTPAFVDVEVIDEEEVPLHCVLGL